MATRLGADYLVEGSVRRRAGMLEVTVRLVRGDRGVQCWSECFASGENDVFEMQATISRQIINRLVTRLPGRPPKIPHPWPPQTPPPELIGRGL